MLQTPQDALAHAARERGVSLSALSRMLGRNVAYLQQFVGRGSPRTLPERDRRLLADFLGLDEAALGAAPRVEDDMAVPYLSVAATAGAGAVVGAERVVRHERVGRGVLRSVGVAPAAASLIDVAGESMAPTLLDGDRVLVNRDDRRVPRAGAIFVIRRDDGLAIKRLLPRGAAIEIRSDNPDHATLLCPVAEVIVVGRARLLLRAI